MLSDSQIITVSGNTLTFAGKTYQCAIGKNGFLADKKEGDGCTPIGIFPLRECWYRADKMAAPKTNLPLRIITQNDGWCDDISSPDYNKHIKLPLPLGEGRGEGGYTYAPPELVERARALRKESTSPEIKLWYILRNRQMNGFKFRRQHPIGIYIADFYCEELRLIIELDGESHFAPEGMAHDKVRSRYLREQGYEIVRFTNAEMLDNFEDVVNHIYTITEPNALTALSSLTLTLSQREREQTPRHEKLWREDDIYDIIIPLGYNDAPIISGKGSAIFLHIAKPDYVGTEGCVALSKNDLLEILPELSPQLHIEIYKEI